MLFTSDVNGQLNKTLQSIRQLTVIPDTRSHAMLTDVNVMQGVSMNSCHEIIKYTDIIDDVLC